MFASTWQVHAASTASPPLPGHLCPSTRHATRARRLARLQRKAESAQSWNGCSPGRPMSQSVKQSSVQQPELVQAEGYSRGPNELGETDMEQHAKAYWMKDTPQQLPHDLVEQQYYGQVAPTDTASSSRSEPEAGAADQKQQRAEIQYNQPASGSIYRCAGGLLFRLMPLQIWMDWHLQHAQRSAITACTAKTFCFANDLCS